MHVYVIEGWHNTLDYEIKTILLRFEQNTEQKIKILKSYFFSQLQQKNYATSIINFKFNFMIYMYAVNMILMSLLCPSIIFRLLGSSPLYPEW